MSHFWLEQSRTVPYTDQFLQCWFEKYSFCLSFYRTIVKVLFFECFESFHDDFPFPEAKFWHVQLCKRHSALVWCLFSGKNHCAVAVMVSACKPFVVGPFSIISFRIREFLQLSLKPSFHVQAIRILAFLLTIRWGLGYFPWIIHLLQFWCSRKGN